MLLCTIYIILLWEAITNLLFFSDFKSVHKKGGGGRGEHVEKNIFRQNRCWYYINQREKRG